MKTYFTEGKNGIYWINSNFKDWFGHTPSEPKKITLEKKVLEKPMTDKAILKAMQPEEVNLDDIAYAMEHADESGILKNGYANLFYVGCRVVLVHWFAGRGWDVNAYEVADPDEWGAGYVVFSRRFFDSQNPDARALGPSDSSEYITRKEFEAFKKRLIVAIETLEDNDKIV